MKAIMISDRPKWCALMMNGEKTIETRKANVGKAVQKLIDENGYADIYVYCSKGKRNNEDLAYCTDTNKWKLWYSSLVKLNGKVIFKFRCYKVEEIFMDNYEYQTDSLDEHNLRIKSQLTDNELHKYLVGKNGYAIHISDLEIFDKPKELSEFDHYLYVRNHNNKKIYYLHSLTKAPQSFMYIESEE